MVAKTHIFFLAQLRQINTWGERNMLTYPPVGVHPSRHNTNVTQHTHTHTSECVKKQPNSNTLLHNSMCVCASVRARGLLFSPRTALQFVFPISFPASHSPVRCGVHTAPFPQMNLSYKKHTYILHTHTHA